MSERAEWIAWVDPARKGDVEAIDRLTQFFSPFVHAVLLARLSHVTASTLVRPVLAQTLFRLEALSSDAGLGSWLLSTARERALEAAKVPGSTTDQPGDDPLVNNGQLVLRGIRQLAEPARERLTMRLVEGISGFEIAELVGEDETGVRVELEHAATSLVRQLTAQVVSFTGDNYLWSLVGTPHPALIPLENQLTAIRYDPTFDPEVTPSQGPALTTRGAPEGRRQTGAELQALRTESTDPSGDGLPLRAAAEELEENTAAIPIPLPLPVPAGNPFGTSVKTIHASDLPAAADFADLQETRAKPAETPKLGEEEDASTLVQPIGLLSSTRVRAAETKVRVEPDPTHTSLPAVRESTSQPRRSLPPPREPDDEPAEDETLIRSGPGGWRAAGVVGHPAPMKTVMGLPAVMVARGSVTRSWRPFGVAGIFALIAIGVSLLLFDGTNRRVRAGWNLVPVVVAGTDLTEGTVITIEMISQRAVPESFVTSSVIKPDSLSYVVNQKILVDAQAGDPLLWSQFEVARSNERLSKKVMRRARAYDILTSKQIAVGGWVQPNDRIDIIASFKANDKGERMAVTLLQNVPVLSTGKITSSTPDSALKDGEKDYIDVSVLLLPEEAELVALAAELGDLQFTLRTEDDHETLSDHRGTNSKTLLQGERVRLLQLKRMKTIQQIRNTRPH